MRAFEYAGYRDAFWFCCFSVGFHFKRTPPLFAERFGYEKFYSLGFGGWRFRVFRRGH